MRLSQAALEALAIVAFKQPITRVEIDSIRGVNSAGVMQKLMELGLIRITGRSDGVGRPMLFGTTREFLVHFGLNSLAELPKPRELEELEWIQTNPGLEAAFENKGELKEIRERLAEIVRRKQKSRSSMDAEELEYTESIQLLFKKLFKDGKIKRELMFIPADYYADGVVVNVSVERACVL